MLFVKHDVERIDAPSAIEKVELCGRLAYKSEDKITKDSAVKFVSNIISSKHFSVLEHASIILCVDAYLYLIIKNIANEFISFSHVNNRYLVSGNIRGWLDLLKDNPRHCDFIARLIIGADNSYSIFFNDFVKSKKKYYTKCSIISESELNSGEEYYIHARPSFRIITDRAISHMIVRHRKHSHIQESQRYCNYSKDKFDNSVKFCIPHWATSIKEGNPNRGIKHTEAEELLIESLQEAENKYFKLIDSGLKAEDARGVLPNDTKTEIIVTGNIKWWNHFLDLRLPNSAHPEIRKIAKKIKEML